MLNYFRQHSLRKLLWLIILFGSLFIQTQNLFSCELMDTPPETICCCEQTANNGCAMGGHDCNTFKDAPLAGCCDIDTKINIGLQDAAVSDTHYKNLSLDSSPPPPAIIAASQFFLPLLSISNKQALCDLSLSYSFTGTNTYFKTSRLRI